MIGEALAAEAKASLRAGFPSPFDILHIDRPGCVEDRRVAVYANRSRILAAARALIAASASRPFSVRRLSDRAEVSAQTIYNNLGNKQEILLAAVNELSSAFISCARADVTCPDPLISFVMGFRDSCRTYPHYHTSTAKMFYNEKILHDRCHRFGTTLMHNMISDMPSFNQDRDGARSRAICSAIGSLIAGATFDMIDTEYDDKRFWDQVVIPSAILSMSISDQRHKQKIEKWISHQNGVELRRPASSSSS